MEKIVAQQTIENRSAFSFSQMFLSRFSDRLRQSLIEHLHIYKGVLKGTKYQRVSIVGIEKDTVYISVLCTCAIEQNGADRICELVMDCAADVKDQYNSIFVRCICEPITVYHGEQILPDDLIPNLHKQDLDKLAEKILREYYPRAMNYAVALPVETFALKLGCHVEYKNINPKNEIYGKVFFADSATTVYSLDGTPGIQPVKRGTIFVNHTFPEAPISRNTVIHECVHWLLHRYAFAFLYSQSEEKAMVDSRNTNAFASESCKSALDRREWQANALAPRILLPAWETRFIAEQWMDKFKRLAPRLRMERVIEHVSSHFKVSKQMTKIRLLELGYKEAELAFDYNAKEQYEIEPIQIAREYYRNPVFREALSDGQYAYVSMNPCGMRSVCCLRRKQSQRTY